MSLLKIKQRDLHAYLIMYIWLLILAYTKWCSYVEVGIPPSTTASGFKAASNPLSNPIGLAPNVFDEVLKATPPALISFLANLPVVEGNYSDFNTIYILVKISISKILH